MPLVYNKRMYKNNVKRKTSEQGVSLNDRTVSTKQLEKALNALEDMKRLQ